MVRTQNVIWTTKPTKPTEPIEPTEPTKPTEPAEPNWFGRVRGLVAEGLPYHRFQNDIFSTSTF